MIKRVQFKAEVINRKFQVFMTIIILRYFRENSFCGVEYTQLPFKTDVPLPLPMSYHQYQSTT